MKQFHGPRRRSKEFKPNSRTQTIKALIERAIARDGFAPSDTQIARTLAMDVARVREHRKALGM